MDYFARQVDSNPVQDEFAALTKDEKLLRDALFWSVLNFATVGGLGGSNDFPLAMAFQKARESFKTLQLTRRCRRPAAIKSGLMGSEEFVS